MDSCGFRLSVLSTELGIFSPEAACKFSPKSNSYRYIGPNCLIPMPGKEGPAIAPDHLLKRTKRQRAQSALWSFVVVVLSLSIVTTDHFAVLWQPILVLSIAIACLALVRNRLLELAFKRISYARYYELRRTMTIPFVIFLVTVLSLLFLGPTFLSRAIFGPILATSFAVLGLLNALGQVLSDDANRNLIFTQFVLDLNKKNLVLAFRWLDRGMYTLSRILREYGMRVDGAALRLGAKFYFVEKGSQATTVGILSMASSQFEDPKKFRLLARTIQMLLTNASTAISRGVSPQPLLIDYLDRRYLTLSNLYRVLTILLALLGALTYFSRFQR